jgi:hypothetical protein
MPVALEPVAVYHVLFLYITLLQMQPILVTF